MAAATAPLLPEDEDFRRKVQGLIRTAQAWDDDPALLAKCRESIPFAELRKPDGMYSSSSGSAEGHDASLMELFGGHPNAIFIQRLCRYFRGTMTWVDQPPCAKCGAGPDMQARHEPEPVRGPETDEERDGEASRVEVYRCRNCQNVHTFPRYNSVRKLFETRRGRCGEYANLFGLYCRAVGFETRYVWDASDHVWTEVCLEKDYYYPEDDSDSSGSTTGVGGGGGGPLWIMCDGCEGVVDEPSMYEVGWNKKDKLSYQIAAAKDHVLDVTARYTRNFLSEPFQLRRRKTTTSEGASNRVLRECNANLWNTLQRGLLLKPKQLAELEERVRCEQEGLRKMQQMTTWESTAYGVGRISGSLSWKIARSEAGSSAGSDEEDCGSGGDGPRKDGSAKNGRRDGGAPGPQFALERFFPPPRWDPGNNNNNPNSTILTIELTADPTAAASLSQTTTTTTTVTAASNKHGAIKVNGAECALSGDHPHTLSVVVVDQGSGGNSSNSNSNSNNTTGGCILMSRALSTAADLVNFLATLPNQRIVALHGYISSGGGGGGDYDAQEKNRDGNDRANNNNDGGMLLLTDEQNKTLSGMLGGLDPSLLVRSHQPKEEEENNSSNDNNAVTAASYGIMYVGQVQAHPDWAYCEGLREAKPTAAHQEADGGTNCDGGYYRVDIELEQQTQQNDEGDSNDTAAAAMLVKLGTFRGVKPSSVVGRLPEDCLPLTKQLAGTHQEKRAAFETFRQNVYAPSSRFPYAGYCTRAGSPVYLLGASAYPLERTAAIDPTHNKENNNKSCWNTFLLLPAPLVADGDLGIVEEDGSNMKMTTVAAETNFEVPVDIAVFDELLGPQLLTSATAAPVATGVALQNTRLVALYFSAHWCPPCRRFTPLLVEMYVHLKEEYPTHGLEMVFISSDRDPDTFRQYYGTMPWLSVPFESPQFNQIKTQLSVRYGVRGIPCLIVLDACSGHIVAPASDSRTEVMQACQHGEDAIESLLQMWIDRVPPETKDLVNMIQLSAATTTATVKEPNSVEEDAKHEDQRRKEVAYLTRPTPVPPAPNVSSEEIMKAAIKEKFTQLVQEGLGPKQAALKAIELATVKAQQKSYDISTEQVELEPGPLNGKAKTTKILSHQSHDEMQDWNDEDAENVKTVLLTAQKYLNNAAKEPWTPRFRTLKLSNKVCDNGITRHHRGISIIEQLGFEIYSTSKDFCATIPLAADIGVMQARIQKLLLDKKLIENK